MTPSEQHPHYAASVKSMAITVSGLDPAPEIDTSNPTALQEDFGFDSLDMLELIMNVEDTFHIELPDAEVRRRLGDDCSIDAIVALIVEKKGPHNE